MISVDAAEAFSAAQAVHAIASDKVLLEVTLATSDVDAYLACRSGLTAALGNPVVSHDRRGETAKFKVQSSSVALHYFDMEAPYGNVH